MGSIVAKYKEVDKRICSNDIPRFLYYITPSNLEEEKLNPYPEFNYPGLDFNPDKKIEELSLIVVPEGELAEVYEKKKDEIIYKLEVLKNRGKRDKVVELSEKLYGKPKKATVDFAKYILEQEQRYYEDPKILGAEDLKKEMEKILEKYNLKDWKIELSEKPEVTVSPLKKRITIGKNRKFSEKDIRRLIEHEIGVHALRAENGSLQPLEIFVAGFPKYLKTEEGLALYREKDTKLLENKKLREYAARVIAVDMMYNGYEFRQIFEELKSYGFSDEEAWNITYRVLRGGGIGKDYIYLEGLREIEELLEKENKDKKLKLLYVGKIGIDDLNLVEELLKAKEIIKPKYFPEWEFI
ncbi:MAG TPA: DUF1704 domain-containing protein [Nanoarchaeota archaeon]|nr:DUF1704 domain-containing protein [Nanoarchaeota archaeon]